MAHVLETVLTVHLDGEEIEHAAAVKKVVAQAVEDIRKVPGVTVSVSQPKLKTPRPRGHAA